MNISTLTDQHKLISPTKLSVSPESTTRSGISTTVDEDESRNREEHSSSTSKQLLHNKLEKDQLIYCIEEVLNNIKEFQHSSASDVDATSSSNTSRQLQMCKKLEKDLDYIKTTMLKLRNFQDRVDTVIGALAVSNIRSSTSEQFSSLRSHLRNTLLQQEIPSLHKILPEKLLPHPHQLSRAPQETDFRDAAGNEAIFIGLDIPYRKEVLESSLFSELEQKFESLTQTERQCLYCFSVFPEKAIIKKRVLMYWWIGEELVELASALKDSEKILQTLVLAGFIEHVYEKRKKKSHGYKIQTFVRPVLTHLATEKGFIEFDSNDEPTMKTQCGSRLCLVKSNSLGPSQSQQQLLKMSKSHLGNVRTLFNINEKSLNLRRDRFSKLKNVKVLQLGTWQQSSSTIQHVEVENSEFLKGLEKMKKLRYLSFRGISGITKLPSSSCIKGLKQLAVLDFSACPHMVELPDAISFLTSLTYLDLSQCYLLSYIPMAVSSLRQLKVLKGFLITDKEGLDRCTIQKLTELTNLEKLSIHIDQRRIETPNTITNELRSLDSITSLQKLMLMWLRVPKTDDNGGELEQSGTTDPLLLTHPSLKKLDLRGFPEFKLVTGPLPELKKMYIRGGKLTDLGMVKWTSIEKLHLKFLKNLHLNWRQLQESFPSLNYLEKVECPKLTFFPCDELGVWQKNRDYYY